MKIFLYYIVIVGEGSINEFSISFFRLQFNSTPPICEDFEKIRPPLINVNTRIQQKVGERKNVCPSRRFKAVFLIQADFQSQFYSLKNKNIEF